MGGGIGGVASAVALGRAGLDVAVFEQAPELREVGAGLTLWPNAMTALRCLGLDESVWALGRSFGVGRIHDQDGRVLVEGANREALERRFGWPGTVLHRTRLLAALAAPLSPPTIRLGARCVGFDQDDRGVTVHFADGTRERGDLLVGADGLNSAIRTGLLGDGPPRYAGYAAYRGITSFSLEGDVAYETWGRGRRFGFVPGPDGDVFWWAATTVAEGRRPPPGRLKDALLSLFRGWFAPIEKVIERTREESILHNDIYDRLPGRRCVSGRVALVGDAAHPVTPDLGQGACLAIEDAVVLALSLQGSPDPRAGLLAYQARRYRRTRFLTAQSRAMGRLGQVRNPVLCRLRNALVPLVPLPLAMLWLSWQFQFTPGPSGRLPEPPVSCPPVAMD